MEPHSFFAVVDHVVLYNVQCQYEN